MQTVSEDRHQVPIVAIGASAGGLEALEEFFSHMMPADSGLAFVVIQHLAPQRASVLAEILARSTQMPVREVPDGARVEADHVYVIAPGTVLGIANGQFQVRPADGERHEPIDAFFKALADDLGLLAAGIVLSGSGADGTRGLRAIQEAGGLTLAQAPDTAAYDAMPRNAIAGGGVHRVLAIREMPAALVERAKAVAEGRIARPELAAPLAASPAVATPSDEELVPGSRGSTRSSSAPRAMTSATTSAARCCAVSVAVCSCGRPRRRTPTSSCSRTIRRKPSSSARTCSSA